MRDKSVILDRLVRLCDQLEIVPGGAAPRVQDDLIDGAQIESIALLQLSALVEEEFGLQISRNEIVSRVRSLDQLAEWIAAALTPAPR